MKYGIPEKYYKGDAEERHPHAHTVGELKKLLDELPDDLTIETTFNEGVALVVFNIDEEGANPAANPRHLQFQDTEEY